jgi:SAM-dependent methyltransferase
MFAEESLWISTVYDKLDADKVRTAGNIGSSSLDFRINVQPHIHKHVIKPLMDKGVRVVNIDLKKETGVDIVADITKPSFGREFESQFDLLLCTNLLEHVTDVKLVVKNLVDAITNRGYILITVPYKYKLHFDPIDNGFRPKPSEIAHLFVGVSNSIIDSAIISINDSREYKKRRSKFPVWGYREKLAYLFGKRYKVSGILLQISK